MPTTVPGIYKQGTIELLETPTGVREGRVLVTILEDHDGQSAPRFLQFGKYSQGPMSTEQDFNIASGEGNRQINRADYREVLANAVLLESRKARLYEAHILRLTEFVKQIRIEHGLSQEIPFFDPADGGSEAQVLFVLEAPGPMAVYSGFVSCDNPDSTAKNMFDFLKMAGITRQQIVLWNVVPWYLGNGKQISAAKREDIRDGLIYLRKLQMLLPNLKAIVLVGRKAQSIGDKIDASLSVRLFKSPHPSPQYVNLHPGNRDNIITVFREVAAHLNTSS